MSTWKVVEKSRTGTTQYLKIQYSPETTPFSESEKYNIEGVYMAGTAIVNDSGGTVTVYGTIDKVNYFTINTKSITGVLDIIVLIGLYPSTVSMSKVHLIL